MYRCPCCKKRFNELEALFEHRRNSDDCGFPGPDDPDYDEDDEGFEMTSPDEEENESE